MSQRDQRIIELRGFIIATRKGRILTLNHETLAYFLCPADIRAQLFDLGFDLLKQGQFLEINVHVVRDAIPGLSGSSQSEIGVFYSIKKPDLATQKENSLSGTPMLSRFTTIRSIR
jgi:hypothetical protein